MESLPISAPQIWLILGVLLLLLEIFIPGLVIGFFGLGALITALLTWVGVLNSVTIQTLVFTLSSVICLFALRKYFKKMFLGDVFKSEEGIYDEDLGKIVEVIEDIYPKKNNGKIKFKGTIWKAQSESSILKGETAKVLKKDNLTIWVEKN